MRNVAVDTQIMRGINASAVLRVLREGGPMGVSAIAGRTGLSRQAVTRSLAGLEPLGLVELRAPEPSETRAGRPAQTVAFRAGTGAVLGVSVAPDSLGVVIADLGGTSLGRRDVPVEAAIVADQLKRTIVELLDELGLDRRRIWAAALGVPGIIDVDTGEIRLSSSMEQVEGDVLRRTLAELLECPIYLDNDVKLATEGERWRESSHAPSSLVLIEWGDRVGAGVILNGSLYRGASNDSGDLGFLRLATSVGGEDGDDDGRLGPFERNVGGGEFVRLVGDAARRRGDEELLARLAEASPEARPGVVIDAVREGRPAAIDGLEVVAVRFARGVAAIRALLDPELIIIGGPMARCGAALTDALAEGLKGETLNQPRIELSTLGGDAVVRGAVHHALSIVEADRLAPEPLAEAMSGR